MSTLTATTEASVQLGAGRKWGLCVFLFLATTLNYLDRQTLSILAPTIQLEMGFDNAALGLLFSVFYYAYTLSQFAVGLLLDRVNLRWAYGLAVLAWSIAAGLTGLAGGLLGLMFFRALLGVAESANWPSAMRIVARALPPKDRTLGNGIFTSGTSIGALVAPATVLAVNAWLGWRAAFALVGSLGALWLVGWLVFTRPTPMAPIWKETPSNQRRGSGGPWLAYGEIVRRKQFWRVFSVTILVNPCLYFIVNWLPTYFVQQWRLDAGATLGWILTTIYLGLDLGYLACGTGVMALVKSGRSLRTARLTVFGAASGLMASAVLLPLTGAVVHAAVVLAVVNFGTGIWIAMYLTMAQEVSERNVSTAAGLLGGSGSLFGALAMWLVGKAVQAAGSFTPAFAALAVAAAVAFLAGWNANRERER